MAARDNRDTVDAINTCLTQLRRAVQVRQRRLATLDRDQARLATAGVVFARPSWRKAKTPGQADKLSIIFPQRAGERARIYVGTDPVKQKQALADMERGRRHRACDADRAAVRAELVGLLNALEHLVLMYGGAL